MKKIIFSLFVIFITGCINAQTVTTLAGTGASGATDGSTTVATFANPMHACEDASGNVYVADNSNHRIRKITSGGVVSTFAGSSQGYTDATGTAAQFSSPWAVCVDASGNVYVAEYDGQRVRKITPGGVVTTLAGNGTAASVDGTGTGASFNYPGGICIDGSGNVYVSEQSGHKIRKITSAGVVTTLAGSGTGGFADGTGTGASFNQPWGICVDGSGNIYVADFNNHRIRKITPAGVVTTLAGSGSSSTVDGTGAGASFNAPSGICIDLSGNLFVSQVGDHIIRKVTTGSVVTTFAGSGSSGSTDGVGTAASFNNPFGIGTGPSGNLFVAEYSNNEIRKITNPSPGAALNFDGVNDYVSIPPSTGLNSQFAGNRITLEGWFYPRSAGSGLYPSLVGEAEHGDGTVKMVMFQAGTVVYAGFYNAGSWFYINSPISYNTWQHIACTYDQQFLKLYINGALTASVAGTAPLPVGTEEWYLGRRIDVGDFYDGKMDEVRIWNRALCQSEIQNNMYSELALPQSSLVAYYKFNQGVAGAANPTVNMVSDAVNSYTGTLINFALSGTISNWVTPGAVTTGSNATAFAASLSASISSQTNVNCFGNNTGAATVTVTSGTATSYSWAPSGGTASVATGLAAGNYTCFITDACGAATSVTVTITQPPALTLAISGTSVICNGNTTTLTASGATSYTWSGGTASTPLDNVPSAGLAVGLRKLRSAYSGNAIRLRRSSDNVEQDFGFVGTELDVASITTFLGGSVGYCKIIYDQSGNGRNVSQTTTSSQPSLTISGINGKPTLHFTSSHFMTNSTNLAAPFTAIYTARQTGPSRARMLASTSNNWLLGWWGGQRKMAHFDGWIYSSGPSSTSDNNTYVYSGSSTGSTASLYENGALVASNSGGVTGPNGIQLNGWVGGTSEASDGDFTEVFVFSSVLSAADRQTVENNTSSYYSVYTSVVTTTANVVNPSATTVYTLTGTNAGCSATITQSVIVNAKPTVVASSGTICSGNSYSIVASGAPTLAITGGTYNVSPSATASYTVTGTDANSCTNTAVSTVSVNTTPTITVNSATICSGASVVITPTAAGISVFAITGGTSTVSPTITTSYSVTGTGTNGCAASNTAVSTVSVKTTPTITVNSATICSNNSVVIAPTGAGAGATYSIQGGNFTVTPNTTTSYSVAATGSNGCVSGSVAATVSVNTTPTLSINSGSICSGNSFAIIPSGNAGGTYSISGNAYTVSPNATASYTLTGTSPANCAAFNTVVSTVSVSASPTLTVNSATICSGNSVVITPGGAGAGGTYSITGGTYTVTPSTTSFYSVTATSSAGCAGSNTIVSTVSVNTTPTVTVNSATICSNNSVVISPTGAGTGATYSVQGGNFTVTPNTTTSYSVAATGSNGCISGSAAATVSVNTTPTLSVNSGSICSGNSFVINPAGNAGGTYTISGGSYTVSPNATASYTLTGTGPGNCAAFNTVVSTVSVSTSPTITVNSATICSGNSVAITPTAAGISVFSITGGTSTVSPTITTSYSVTGTGTNGCVSSNTAVSTISVNTTPSITVNSATICSGSTVVIAPNGAGTGATYSIQGGNFNVSPGTTTSYSVAGTASNGCVSGSVAASVSVNITPTLTATSGAMCPGNVFTITSGGNAGGTYTISGGSYTVQPGSTTSYSLTGTGLGNCPASNTAVSTVTVVNTLSVSVSGPTTVCSGAAVTLTANGATTYSWSPVNINTNTAALSPTVNTTYTVLGVSGTCSNTAVVSLSVLTTPTITVNSATICSGIPVVIAPTGAGTGATYSIQGGNFNVSPTITTTYSVTGTGTNGCVSGSLAATVSVNITPTLSVNNGSICSNKQFTIVPSGNASGTYTITGGTYNVSPTVTTSYTLTGTGPGNCAAFNTVVSTVTVATTPTLAPLSNFNICSNNSLVISASGAGTNGTYTITGGTFTITPNTTTSYSVTGTSSAGCAAFNTVVSTVSVNTTPSITVNSATICSGTSVAIAPNGAGTGATYSIQGGNFNVTPTITTTYSVTGTGSNACVSASVLATVSVNTTPTLTANSGAMCPGNVFTITPGGNTGGTYTITGNSYTVQPSGTTSYTLTGTGAGSCTAIQAVATVSVVNTLSVSVTGPTTVCNGAAVTLTANGASNYSWTPTAIFTATAALSPTTNTTYTVLGVSGACSNTAVVSLSVLTTPTITASSATICSGSIATITPNGAGIGATYSIQGGSFTVTPNATTSYSVTGTATNGCVSSSVAATVSVNSTPTLTVNSATICSGSSVVITPTGSAASYSISGNTFTVTPNATGNYSVTGTGANNCVSSAIISTITVKTTPTVTANSATICSGKIATITPNGAGIGGTYTIQGSNFTVTPASNTTYSVTGTGTNGCTSASIAVTVSVNTTPTITVNSLSICAGSSAVITPTGAGTAASYSIQGGSFTVTPLATTSYSATGTGSNGCISASVLATVSIQALPVLSVNSASICAGTTAVITPSGAATYSISGNSFSVNPASTTSYSVTGTSTSGCVSSAAVSTITVNNNPTITVNSASICSGTTAVITPSGAATYTISGGNFTVSPTATTDYSVTGTDTNGCLSNEAISSITVNITPTITVNSTAICLGNSAVIIPAGADTYTISSGSFTVTPGAGTSYSVIGSSTAGCISNEAVSSITVNILPTVTAATSEATICVNETATLTAGGAVTYSWNTAQTGTIIATNPSVAGTVIYTVTGTDANGCANTGTVAQTADPCVGISKQNTSSMSLQVYPNPNNGQFTIVAPKNTGIVIINTVGQIVYTENTTAETTSINMDHLAHGIYFIKATNGNSQQTIKLIKE